MLVTLLAHHIEWDSNGDNTSTLHLPSKHEVQVDIRSDEWLFPTTIEEQIKKQLIDATGFTPVAYRIEGYSADANFALQMTNATE